ncbi:MAG: LacI family transcriptional regulator [Propionibacteriaceae bacterium]|jgi:LacI family transcriptional regulator|nr:LacI family transcriptional regulator [Propionibacteriaceae bacterium]
MARHRSATLEDIARVAGVSPATVSRALNGSDKPVSAQLRLRITAVADSLGYVSNRAAAALRGRRTAVFILIPDPREPIIAQAAGVEIAARERGVLASAVAIGTGAAAHIKAIQTLSNLRPRALIVNYHESESVTVLPHLSRYVADGGRVVTMGRNDGNFPSILYHDVESGRLMGEHLASLGRSSWAIVTSRHPALSDRMTGAIEAMHDHGLPPPVAIETLEGQSRDLARTAIRRIWESGERPGIVYATNDTLAVGVMDELRNLGVRVPEDVAVAGNDDIPIARDLTPSLTTIALDFLTAGRLALDLALSEEDPANVSLPGHLVVRESTRVV